MADSDNDKTPGKPPKINLSNENGNGLPKPKPIGGQEKAKDTARIDLSEAKTNLDAAKTDLDSARSDLGGAAKDDTTRIDLPKSPPKNKPKSDTAKVDLAEAKPAGPDDTSRIDLPSRKSETARISIDQARAKPPAAEKSETHRVEGEAESEAPTRGVDSLTQEQREEIMKKSTIRADADASSADGAAGDFSPATSGIDQLGDEDRKKILKQTTAPIEKEAARNQTARVNLDEARAPGSKSDSARIETVPAKKDAARAQTGKEPGTGDVVKRQGPAPATAPTPVAKPPAPGEPPEPESPPRSETARVSPALEAEKSKTARIEVPAELATPGAGRPKTIRIKRADSTAGPVQAAIPEPTIKKSAKGKKKKGKRISSSDDEVGALYSVLTLVSLIVVVVVVYVLLAQVLDPSLPWIGKISL